jgi:hypothetical protein
MHRLTVAPMLNLLPPTPALGPIIPFLRSNVWVTDFARYGSEYKRRQSFIPTDAGFFKTWNADSSAIKLSGPGGQGYWLEFN